MSLPDPENRRRRSPAPTGDDAIDPVGTTACVLNNHERERFDMWVGDELVGVLGYLDERDTGAGGPSDRRVVAFMHTVVAEEWTGKGLGALLVREAFADARSRDWTVRLACPYAHSILTDEVQAVCDLAARAARRRVLRSIGRGARVRLSSRCRQLPDDRRGP